MLTKPMKAPSKSTTPAEVIYPALASYKLDGLRALHLGDTVHSKTLELFRNKYVTKLFSDKRLAGLDGELIVGSPCGQQVINRTFSGVMSAAGEPNVVLYVFDDFTQKHLPFHLRYSATLLRVKQLNLPHVAMLLHKRVRSAMELQSLETMALSKGYEGLMVRSMDGPYKEGTCTVNEGWLRKLKRFEDSEAVLCEVLQGHHNANEGKTAHKAGMVASSVVGTLLGNDLKTGQAVRVAPGKMTAPEREYWWQNRKAIVGRICTYRWFPTDGFTVPRFPTFQCWRDPIDI